MNWKTSVYHSLLFIKAKINSCVCLPVCVFMDVGVNKSMTVYVSQLFIKTKIEMCECVIDGYSHEETDV